MKCPRCQHENPSQARFCMGCGAGLTARCASCGAELPADARFCFSCGRPLQGFAGSPRFESPGTYTPKHLAERIINSKAALEGERKQVTVLFADLKGSMELLADRDPEEARKILDPVLERMMEAVHRYEGTVNQVMGDGIMALFGAPLSHEDHAVRACYAALRMQESVKRYADGVRRQQGIMIGIRVGLNSGEVVVRAIGSDLHMDYTAVGQTTHLAARMEQLARPETTLISAHTLRLAEGFVQVHPLGRVPVKGIDEPIEMYEITGAGSVRSRMEAAAARGLTNFVGRHRELDTLRQALENAAAGHGQIVALVGEPGVGKSRLFREFTRSHDIRDWLLLQSGSVSYGRATPYQPIIDLLKAYFQIETSDDPRKIREKVTGKLLTLDRTLETALPVFLGLLDVATSDADWEALDPPQRRHKTLQAVKGLLITEARVQPVCLVVEDLHWIDAETQAVLDSVVESLPTAHALLLVNYRPEYEHKWGSKTYYTQLRIDPLSPDNAEQLLQALVGSDASLLPLKQFLVARTQGNPFFLEESVRTLVETEVLVGDRGAHRLTKALADIQVPATVQAVLAARIDRLVPEDKRLLQGAAVIGEDVPFALLQAIAEDSEENLRRGLSHLQAAEFLYEARLFPDLEYTFKHGLTYQVAYGTLLQERRRALHARIAEEIERLYRDRLAEQVDRLAHHSFRGELWQKALTYVSQAGSRAAARSANRAAAAWFEQALEIVQRLPDDRETLERAVDLRLELRRVLFALGDYERMFTHLCEAERLATMLGDDYRLGWILVGWTVYRYWMGEQQEAIKAAHRSRVTAENLKDVALQAVADTYLGWAHHSLGDCRTASELFHQSVARLGPDRFRERFGQAAIPAVFARARLAWCLGELGDFAAARRFGDEAVQIAESADQPFSVAVASLSLGSLSLLKGDVATAIPALERTVSLCRVWNIGTWLPTAASSLGYAYVLSRRFDEAFPLLEEAMNLTASMKIQHHDAFQLGWLSEGLLADNRSEAAIPLAERAFHLSRDGKHRGQEASAQLLLGEIELGRDARDLKRAEDYYQQAMALAEELGRRPVIAHCHAGLAKLYRHTGKQELSAEQYQIATSMYRDMGMQFWLQKTEAAMA